MVDHAPSSHNATARHELDIHDDALAMAAVQHVTDGMMVGLGTGRAASRGIQALAARVRDGEVNDISTVATSIRSADLARSLGLLVLPMCDVQHVDLLFDGADEVDANLCMTKGAGGAMTREKIVAEASARRIYLIDDSKLVERLGTRVPLPVEVLRFGLEACMLRLRGLGLEPVIRPPADPDRQEHYVTDEGNLVLDCAYPKRPAPSDAEALKQLSIAIDVIPGVVGHGLFVDQADIVIIENTARTELTIRTRR